MDMPSKEQCYTRRKLQSGKGWGAPKRRTDIVSKWVPETTFSLIEYTCGNGIGGDRASLACCANIHDPYGLWGNSFWLA